MRPATRHSRGSRAGSTLIELSLTFSILVVVLLATFTLLQRDAHLAESSLSIQIAEMKAQHMVYQLQRELADARGSVPVASVIEAIPAGAVAQISVDTTLGFPDQGTLIVERGSAQEEFISYTGITATTFTGITRADRCTQDLTHNNGVAIIWSGVSDPIQLQPDPPAVPPIGTFDGQIQVPGRNLFFRGEGSGFSYRVPTDPAGGTDYLLGDSLQWGAQVAQQQRLSGWSALYFAPRYTYDESQTADDVNRDGDTTDIFDVGQIRRRSWDTADPTVVADDVGMGPTVFLQEQCAWGSDLNSDGFEDPIFFWNQDRRQLHIRLFILGRNKADVPIVRMVETSIFLRNEAED